LDQQQRRSLRSGIAGGQVDADLMEDRVLVFDWQVVARVGTTEHALLVLSRCDNA